jgi:hypothetical protein
LVPIPATSASSISTTKSFSRTIFSTITRVHSRHPRRVSQHGLSLYLVSITRISQLCCSSARSCFEAFGFLTVACSASTQTRTAPNVVQIRKTPSGIRQLQG